MASTLELALLAVVLILNGLLAGASLDKAITQLPARRTISTLRAMVRGEIASPSVDVRGRGHCGGFGPVSSRPLQAEGRLTSARGGRVSPGDTCPSRSRGRTSRAPVVPPSC